MNKKDQIRFDSETNVTIRRKDGSVEFGTLSNVEDGKPIPSGAELVEIRRRPSQEWHDSETLYRSGPPQVATPAYRDGYDRIFGKKEVGLA